MPQITVTCKDPKCIGGYYYLDVGTPNERKIFCKTCNGHKYYFKEVKKEGSN